MPIDEDSGDSAFGTVPVAKFERLTLVTAPFFRTRIVRDPDISDRIARVNESGNDDHQSTIEQRFEQLVTR
ncbi:MAG: hypothetical protein ABIN56_11450 [Dokdonella sp.]